MLATNLVAAVWGAIGWARKDARASIVFWPLLRAAQATVVVQVVLGLLLVARGASAPDGLHIVYGVAPLIVTFVSEGMRVALGGAPEPRLPPLLEAPRPPRPASSSSRPRS